MTGIGSSSPDGARALSIVLCTYERAERLRVALGDLARCRIPEGWRCELIVVDNNSSDHTAGVVREAARKLDFPVRYVFEREQGKSHALNTGIRAADGEVVAFTDDDVRIREDWIVGLARAFEEDGDCAGIGGRIVADWPGPKPEWYQGTGPYRLMDAVVQFEHGEEPVALDTPPFGANMAFRAKVFRRHGLFRTDLGPERRKVTRGEDTEFCRRLLGAGERLVYRPDVVVRHPVEPDRTRKSFYRSFYFHHGRTAIRVHGRVGDGPRIGGVPLRYLRDLAGHLRDWLTTGDVALRFYHELQSCMVAGYIAESLGGPGAMTPESSRLAPP